MIGNIIDLNYQVIESIGEGSQGEIFKVKDIKKSRILALKLISIKNKSEEENLNIIKNIAEEFKLIKKINHENIIKVFDFGFDKNINRYYYTMEYLEGVNLSEFMHANYTEDIFTEITYQVLNGLSFLHSNDIIHFDIKPDNIFILNDENGTSIVKILDFGLSELKKDDNLKNTLNNKIKGTMAYIAPEMFLDSSLISEKTDLYSLGITLIHSLTSKESFSSLSKSISSNILSNTINICNERNKYLLDSIENQKIGQFISKLIEPNPDIRITSAKEAISSLNFLFEKKFKIPLGTRVHNFANNSRFLLRENIVEEIEGLYDIFINEETWVEKNDINAINLIGNSGDGKTKILDQIYYDHTLSLKKVIKFEILEEEKDILKIAGPLLLSIYNLFGKEIELTDDFQSITKDIDELKELQRNVDFSIIHEKIISFIKKAIQTTKLLLLFDSYEKYDNESMKLILKLIDSTKENKNLFSIIAFSPSTIKSKKNSIDFLTDDPNIKNIKINPLEKEEIEKIQDLLIGEVTSLPKDYFSDLFEYSKGNFKKVMIFLDTFFNESIFKDAAGIYVFSNKKLFYEILKRDSKTLLQKDIKQLSDKEQEIAFLLAVSFSKLTISEIQRLTKNSRFIVEKALDKLKNKNIVKSYNNLSVAKFKIIRNEIKDAFLSLLTKKKLKEYYIGLLSLEAKNKFEFYASRFISMLLAEDMKVTQSYIQNLSEIHSKMTHYDKHDNLYYILTNLSLLVKNKDMHFYLVLGTAKLLKNKNFPKAAKILKKIDKIKINEISIISFKIEYILTKLDFYDITYFNFDPVRYFKKYYLFLHEMMDKDKFYSKIIKVIDLYIVKYPNNLLKTKHIINILKALLQKEKNISPEYLIILNLKEIEKEIIPWADTHIQKIQDYIEIFEKNKITNKNYFKLLHSYFMICSDKDYDEGVEKKLNSSINLAYKLKRTEDLIQLLNAGGEFYFDQDNYKKSLVLSEKILEIHNKTHIDIGALDTVGTLLATKFCLYYPYGEIQTLLKSAKTGSKEKGDMIQHFTNLGNEIIIQYKLGNFIATKKAVAEFIGFLKNVSEKELYKTFDIISVYFPTYLKKDYIYMLIGVQFANDLLKASVVKKLYERIEIVYKYTLPYKWSPDNYDNILNGTLQEETPAVLMAYIKKNKHLPKINKVIDVIPDVYKNDDYIAPALAFKTTSYMLTKNHEFLENIKTLSKKLSMRGYVAQLYFILTPLVEFMVMAKNNDEYTDFFINLLNETNENIKINSDLEEQEIWKTTAFYRNATKAIKFYYKKIKK